jgi:hypothetical protein
MIAEILGVIAAGVGIVQGVTTTLRNLQELGTSPSPSQVSASIRSVEERVGAVEQELQNHANQGGNESRLATAYTDLIRALQEDENYSSRIEIIPTSYGTWKIIRRKRQARKPTVLRDSQGEYHNLDHL